MNSNKKSELRTSRVRKLARSVLDVEQSKIKSYSQSFFKPALSGMVFLGNNFVLLRLKRINRLSKYVNSGQSIQTR